MKIKIIETIAIFTWVTIVFYWAIYANIPKATMEYLIKTLPLIILGIWVIEVIIKKYKNIDRRS